MALFNHLLREVNAKIVYFGPGLSGKQTSIAYICQKLDPDIRSPLKAMQVQGNRMLFFNFCPSVSQLDGYSVRFHLYTVTGEVFKPSSWKVAFKGVDGVVFVADSDPERQQENLDRLKELRAFLAVEGTELTPIPFVMQYNGRDLPEALPLEELQRKLNRDNVPGFPTVASHGEGVHAPLSCLTNMVLANIREELDAELEAQLAAESEEEDEVEAKSAVEPSSGSESPVSEAPGLEMEDLEFELSDEMAETPSPPEEMAWPGEDETKFEIKEKIKEKIEEEEEEEEDEEEEE